MRSGFAKPPYIHESSYAAICVLALVSQRPQGVDELLPRNEESADGNAGNVCTELDSEDCAQDLEIIYEDEDVDVDESVEEPLHLTQLRDKVLDRLAETLERFKSDPNGNRGPPLDPKHVSSTMIIEYRGSEAVRSLCAKNEGLDQRDTTEDTDFLESWRKCMECISKREPAAEEAKESLFNFVLEYQRPRIMYFTKKLKDAFAAAKVPIPSSESEKTKLSQKILKRVPGIRSRKCINDHENEFIFGPNKSSKADADSEAAASGDSLKNVNTDVDVIFSFTSYLLLRYLIVLKRLFGDLD